MTTIHKRIREARLKKKITLVELGNIMGVSPQAVNSWEKEGGNIPKSNKITRLAEALDVSPNWLQFGMLVLQIGDNYDTNNQDNLNQTFEHSLEKERLSEIQAQYLKDIPLFDIDDAIEFALNPDTSVHKIYDSNERVATFIPHSKMTFGLKVNDNSVEKIAGSKILQNDILIIEPKIKPRNNDFVLICLDYKGSRRGIIARLLLDLENNRTIQYNEFPPAPMPLGSLICGVVTEIKRRLMPTESLKSRLDSNYNILESISK